MNLINDPWIPVRRLDHNRERIAPWQITDQHHANPILAIDTPRADFDGSLMQFLIGLLQTTTDVEEDDWEGFLLEPPTSEELREQFAPVASAFELDGGERRFMQDLQLTTGDKKDRTGISALLIEAPGENSLKNNIDHFIKRGGVEGLCPACAAAALFTLQTNAPSGGAGHRTSLRGGGPLTTLVIFDPRTGEDELGATLWRNLWMNVLDRPAFFSFYGGRDKTAPADTFPWLAPTRTSEPKTGRDTTAEDVHPAQMYWAMPRRIRFDFDNTRVGRCDLCGVASETLVTHYVTKNYGVNYTGPWQHPLSPHNIGKEGTPLPRHPRPGGLGYRHWLGLVQDQGETRQAARVVNVFFKRKSVETQFLLRAFGYDMDNMKARCWYESVLPLYQIPDPMRRKDFETVVNQCVAAATEVRFYLLSALKTAWFKRPGDVRGDFSFIELAFWQDTEADFYALLHDFAEAMQTGSDPMAAMNQARERWYTVIRRQALDLFDRWAASGVIEYENPRRIAQSHNKLNNLLRSKKLRVDILELPVKTPKVA